MWTHWPTSGFFSGWKLTSTPTFFGVQCSPESSDRKTPAAEMPAYIRFGRVGSRTIEWRHIPPAPGFHRGRVRCWFSPSTAVQLAARSSERNSIPGSTPRKSDPGSFSGPGVRCQRLTIGPGFAAPISSWSRSFPRAIIGGATSVHRTPPSFDRKTRGPNQPEFTSAYTYRGSRGSATTWKTSLPAWYGPRTDHFRRCSSLASAYVPFRVPTQTATFGFAMFGYPPWIECRMSTVSFGASGVASAVRPSSGSPLTNTLT